jgi:hypothetical protein
MTITKSKIGAVLALAVGAGLAPTAHAQVVDAQEVSAGLNTTNNVIQFTFTPDTVTPTPVNNFTARPVIGTGNTGISNIRFQLLDANGDIGTAGAWVTCDGATTIGIGLNANTLVSCSATGNYLVERTNGSASMAALAPFARALFDAAPGTAGVDKVTFGTVCDADDDQLATGCTLYIAPTTGTRVITAPAQGTGSITLSAGPAVGPTITYTPATGGTVTFPAATSIGGTTTQAITLAGAGGQNGGTTVLSACSSTVGNITFTDGADTCTAGGACVDASLDLQCVSTNGAQTGTATCTETRQNESVSGDGITVVSSRTWNVSCPAANVAPALAYAPAPGPITMPTVGQGQTANSSIAVTPSLGSGTGSSTVSGCAFSGAVGATFTAPVGTLTFTGSGTMAQNLNFSCVAPTNGQPDGTATLTCSENIGGSINPRVWNVTCPDGLPVAAPNVNYSQAGGTTITFPAGASVGSSVPGSVSIDIDINGGAPGGGAGPETASVSCSATAGFTVTGGTAGPIAAVAANGTDTTAVVSCTSAASAQAGTLTCVASQVIDGGAPTTTNTTYPLDCAAADVNITSAPPAGPISLAGAPLTNVSGSIVLSNSGSDSTLGCSATGAVTLGVVPGTVPSAGSATVPYTCLTGAAGVAGTGQIVCQTQDPDAEATLTYDISCVGLSDVPVPAINNFGKLLMVVLVIGLGLVGLGARRQ